jgi:hypothetical protein
VYCIVIIVSRIYLLSSQRLVRKDSLFTIGNLVYGTECILPPHVIEIALPILTVTFVQRVWPTRCKQWLEEAVAYMAIALVPGLSCIVSGESTSLRDVSGRATGQQQL